MFLENRWRETRPRYSDRVTFCPYYEALVHAVDTGFAKETVKLYWKTEPKVSAFRKWYWEERNQERNGLLPSGDVKAQLRRNKKAMQEPRLFSRAWRGIFIP